MHFTQECQEFTALLEKHDDLDASYITIPFSVPEVYGKKGLVKITCTFDRHPYRGSLAPMGNNGHILIVIKKIRKAINKTFGDMVTVTLRPDTEPRTVQIPPDLKAAFELKPELKGAFDKMSYTHRKEYANWLESAKKPENRQKRLEKTIGILTEKVKG